MGVLPCQFKEGTNAASLNLDGTETFDITGLENVEVQPRQDVTLTIHRANGETEAVPLILTHRHTDRDRLLPARRHPALCVEAVVGGDDGVLEMSR